MDLWKRFERSNLWFSIYIHTCIGVYREDGRNRGVLHEQGRSCCQGEEGWGESGIALFLSVVAIRLSERSTRAFSFALTLRLVSSSSFSTRSSLSLSFSLVECLDFSTNPRINPPSSSGKPPAHAPSKRRQLVSHWPIPRTPSRPVHAKELNQNNKQTRKSDYRGGPCLDVAWREIVRAILSLFLTTISLWTVFIVAIFRIKSQIRKNNIYIYIYTTRSAV